MLANNGRLAAAKQYMHVSSRASWLVEVGPSAEAKESNDCWTHRAIQGRYRVASERIERSTPRFLVAGSTSKKYFKNLHLLKRGSSWRLTSDQGGWFWAHEKKWLIGLESLFKTPRTDPIPLPSLSFRLGPLIERDQGWAHWKGCFALF